MNKTYHIAVLVLGLSLFGCGGGGGGGGTPTDPGDTTAPNLSTQSPAGQLIKPDTGITLRFDESIDTSSFSLGGNLAAESDGGVWSQTDVIDDTLTITPNANWSVDTGRTLVINAKDLAGNAMAELTISHDVHHTNLYYVSSAAADDTGDGLSPATAKLTIRATIEAATAPATVVVNTGDYAVSYSPDTRVWLKEGVSLYGGYSADFVERIPGSSVIVDKSTYIGSDINPNFAVIGDGGAGITGATLIDGFTLQGSTQPGVDFTSAIRMRFGAAPTVQNNIIHGGSGLVISYGMHNNASSPTVHNNTLNGGNSAGFSDITGKSYGMYNTSSSSPTVENNTIDGGSAGYASYGMYNNDASPTVQNNTINGGSAASTYGMINFSGSSPTVQDNTINGGSGGSSSTGMHNSRSSPSVLNNTISAGSGDQLYGMYNSLFSSPTVQDNTINGGSGGSISTGMINVQSSPTVLNNIFNGGSGRQSFGMRIISSSSLAIQHNTINGGSGTASYGMDNQGSEFTLQNNTIHGGSGGTQTFGMLNDGSILTLQNNIIYGGDDSDESRGIQSTSSELIIQNNTIDGGGGIDESWAISNFSTSINLDNNILIAEVSDSSICYVDYLSAPDSMQNNDFVGCEFTYRMNVGPPIIYEWFTTIEEVNALTGASNNIAVDPQFIDQAGGDYHLSASSPTSVTADGLNGVDEGWGFSDDKDGVTRPAAGSTWAIGAYELN